MIGSALLFNFSLATITPRAEVSLCHALAPLSNKCIFFILLNDNCIYLSFCLYYSFSMCISILMVISQRLTKTVK